MTGGGGPGPARRARADQHIAARSGGNAQQVFLAELSCALRPLTDPDEIRGVAISMAGEFLEAHHSYFAETEESRRLSDAYYRTLFDAINEGFVVAELLYDAEGRAIDVRVLELSPSFARMMHIPDGAGVELLTIFPGEPSDWLALYEEVIATGAPIRKEAYVSLIDARLALHISRVGGPELHRFAIVCNDISERKEADATLHARAERHAFLLRLSDALRAESGPDAVAVAATHLLAAHLQLDRCYIARLSLAEQRAWLAHEYHHPDLHPVAGEYQLEDLASVIWARSATGRVIFNNVQTDSRLSAREKSRLAAIGIGSYLVPPPQTGEQDLSWMLVAATRSPRQWSAKDYRLLDEASVRTWAAIEQARVAQLDQQDRIRRTFIASVTHDVQTPLTALRAGLGLLEMSASARLQEAEAALLTTARRTVDRLGVQLNDFLTANQLTADTFQLDPRPLDLRTVLLQAVAVAEPLMRQKEQHLRLDIAGPLPVNGDPGRLEQALLNLLVNASRHTPQETTVTLHASNETGQIVLRVADDGPGIPKDVGNRIFERFYRADATVSGSGLGLTIARAIAEHHGGSLELEGNAGPGATFTLRLPRLPASEDHPE